MKFRKKFKGELKRYLIIRDEGLKLNISFRFKHAAVFKSESGEMQLFKYGCAVPDTFIKTIKLRSYFASVEIGLLPDDTYEIVITHGLATMGSNFNTFLPRTELNAYLQCLFSYLVKIYSTPKMLKLAKQIAHPVNGLQGDSINDLGAIISPEFLNRHPDLNRSTVTCIVHKLNSEGNADEV